MHFLLLCKICKYICNKYFVKRRPAFGVIEKLKILLGDGRDAHSAVQYVQESHRLKEWVRVFNFQTITGRNIIYGFVCRMRFMRVWLRVCTLMCRCAYKCILVHLHAFTFTYIYMADAGFGTLWVRQCTIHTSSCSKTQHWWERWWDPSSDQKQVKDRCRKTRATRHSNWISNCVRTWELLTHFFGC